ncbi:MAG: methyltransferase domain-containing protein [bacterium]
MDGETPRCPLCGHEKTKALFVKAGRTVALCPACRAGFVHPMPEMEELKELYGRDYFHGGGAVGYTDYDAQSGAGNEWTRYYLAERLDDLERRRGGKRGRLLEAGCAFGCFLAMARERGWDVEGAEISAYAAREAEKRYGMRVHACPLEDAPLEEGTFDAVAAFEVIEHLPRPASFLGRVNRLLKDGGILVMTTPNDLFSLRAKLTRDKSSLVKLPEHLYFFSPLSLGRLVTGAGFEILSLYTFEAKMLRRGRAVVERRMGAAYRFLRPAVRPLWRFVTHHAGLGEAIYCAAVKPRTAGG